MSRGLPGAFTQRVDDGEVPPAALTTPTAHRGVHLSRFRIRIFRDDRIKLVGVVDQRKLGHVALIELEVRDAFPIGTPVEAVAKGELLFVDPIGSPIDDEIAAVAGDGLGRAGSDVLDPDVVILQVAGLGSIRRQLGVEQRRLRLAAELVPAFGLPVQHPIVVRRLADHDALRLRREQHAIAVRGHRVVREGQRRVAAGRRQLRGRHQHVALAGRGVVADNLAVLDGAVKLPALTPASTAAVAPTASSAHGRRTGELRRVEPLQPSLHVRRQLRGCGQCAEGKQDQQRAANFHPPIVTDLFRAEDSD